jgi:biotin carboxyl carrier protein
MKNYKFRINGNQYEVEVLEIEGNMAKIEVNGTVYDVEMQREIPKVKAVAPPAPVQTRPVKDSKPAPESAPGKASDVRAPLPGVIIQVLVRRVMKSNPGRQYARLKP